MDHISLVSWVVLLLFGGTFINAIDRASLSTAAPVLIVPNLLPTLTDEQTSRLTQARPAAPASAR